MVGSSPAAVPGARMRPSMRDIIGWQREQACEFCCVFLGAIIILVPPYLSLNLFLESKGPLRQPKYSLQKSCTRIRTRHVQEEQRTNLTLKLNLQFVSVNLVSQPTSRTHPPFSNPFTSTPPPPSTQEP